MTFSDRLEVISTFLVMVNAGAMVGYKMERIPAWVWRNTNRAVTLIYVPRIWLRPGDRWWSIFIVVLGIVVWNWPKDGKPPRIRKRKRERVAEKRAAPDWSGAQAPVAVAEMEI